MKSYEIILTVLIALAALIGIGYFCCCRLVAKLFTTTFGRIDEENLRKTIQNFDDKIASGPLAHRLPMLQAGRAWIAAFPKEQISILSHDGLRLVASLFERPQDDSAALGLPGYGKTLLLFHGYHSSAAYDFSGACAYYYALGFRLVLVDQRTHGQSQGEYVTFGALEQRDVISWCTRINERYGSENPILLTGISMGATTVLLAAGRTDLPQNVIGVIADCGYADAHSELSHVARQYMHLPPFPMMNILCRQCRRAGFSLDDCSAEHALKNARIPIFFAHGEQDRFVPPEHTHRNAAACASRHTVQLVKGAGHGMSYLVDPEHSQALIRQFIESL